MYVCRIFYCFMYSLLYTTRFTCCTNTAFFIHFGSVRAANLIYRLSISSGCSYVPTFDRGINSSEARLFEAVDFKSKPWTA